MQGNGIAADQITQVRGFADQRLRKPDNPLDPSNRRISIIVQYIEKNPEAEEGKSEGGEEGKASAGEEAKPSDGKEEKKPEVNSPKPAEGSGKPTAGSDKKE